MFAVMPLLALALAAGFNLQRSLEVALVTVALSPVPPVLPKKQVAAGGTSSYALGLVAVTAVFSVVFIPVAVQVLGWALGRSLDVPVGLLIQIVATSLLLPLVAGMAIRKAAPEWADRIAGKIALGAGILLLRRPPAPALRRPARPPGPDRRLHAGGDRRLRGRRAGRRAPAGRAGRRGSHRAGPGHGHAPPRGRARGRAGRRPRREDGAGGDHPLHPRRRDPLHPLREVALAVARPAH